MRIAARARPEAMPSALQLIEEDKTRYRIFINFGVSEPTVTACKGWGGCQRERGRAVTPLVAFYVASP